MKIRIEARELKTLLEKVLPVIDNKAKVETLKCVLLESNNSTLSATTTDLESHLTVKTNNFSNMENGSILIYIDDIKLINKLKDDLEISLLNEYEVLVKSGKKSITVKNYDIESYPKINLGNMEEQFELKENDFLNTINKLINFISKEDSRKTMQYYNINLEQDQIESLDGHRIGIIDMEFNKLNNDIKSMLIHSNINKHLKKVLDKKSEAELQFMEHKRNEINNNDFNIIKGNSFTYIQRKTEGSYFNVSQMIISDYDFKIEVNKKELLDISKFNMDMVAKVDKKPMIFNYNNETKEHHIYIDNNKNKSIDKLEVVDADMMNKDFNIGFNPKFIYEALKCLDDEEAIITGTTYKSPILISGDSERYLVLPVNLGEPTIEEVKDYIRNVA